MPNNAGFVPPILSPLATSLNDYSAEATYISVTANVLAGVDILVASGGPIEVVMPATGVVQVFAGAPGTPVLLPNGEEVETFCLVIELGKVASFNKLFPTGIPTARFFVLEGIDVATFTAELDILKEEVDADELTDTTAHSTTPLADAKANWKAEVLSGNHLPLLDVERRLGDIALNGDGEYVLRFRAWGIASTYEEQDAAAVLACMATHVDPTALGDWEQVGDPEVDDTHPVCLGAASAVAPTEIHLHLFYYDVTFKEVRDLESATVRVVNSTTNATLLSGATDATGLLSFPATDLTGISFHFEITPSSPIDLGAEDSLPTEDPWSTLGWESRNLGKAWFENCMGFQVGTSAVPMEIFYGVPFSLRGRFTALQYDSTGSPIVVGRTASVVSNLVAEGTELVWCTLSEEEYTEIATFRADSAGEFHGILVDVVSGTTVEPCYSRRLTDSSLGITSFRQVDEDYSELPLLPVGNILGAEIWRMEEFTGGNTLLLADTEDWDIAPTITSNFVENAMLALLKYTREAHQWWATLLGSHAELGSEHVFRLVADDSTADTPAHTGFQSSTVTSTSYHTGVSRDSFYILQRFVTAHEYAHAVMLRATGLMSSNVFSFNVAIAMSQYVEAHAYTRQTTRFTALVECYGDLLGTAWGRPVVWGTTGSGTLPKDMYQVESGAALSASSVDPLAVEGAVTSALWEYLTWKGLTATLDTNSKYANMDLSTSAVLTNATVRAAFDALIWQPTKALASSTIWVGSYPVSTDLFVCIQASLGADYTSTFYPNYVVPWDLVP